MSGNFNLIWCIVFTAWFNKRGTMVLNCQDQKLFNWIKLPSLNRTKSFDIFAAKRKCHHRRNDRGSSYHFFWANQWKVDIKIFSWSRCEICKDRHDWQILAENDQRIISHCLNRLPGEKIIALCLCSASITTHETFLIEFYRIYGIGKISRILFQLFSFSKISRNESFTRWLLGC